MRYTIGTKVVDKEKNGLRYADGIYAFGKFGLPYISSVEKLGKEDTYIYVIDTTEDAENFVRYLSRLYRMEFRSRAKKAGVSVDNYKFYLVRFDTPVFKSVKIEKSIDPKENKDKCVNVDLKNVHLCKICATV
jgi:hypothetical protein